MKISKFTIVFLLPFCLFLGGCESIKNITDPLGDDKEEMQNVLENTTSGGVTINDVVFHVGSSLSKEFYFLLLNKK